MAVASIARAFAERQHKLDEAQVRAFPQLLIAKQTRMLASPHAFFRGSAPLFYAILKERKLAEDLVGPVAWLVGDMHVENIGAFRTDDNEVVFDLNDFDEAAEAPVSVDVVRLLTSVILSGRAISSTSSEMIAHAQLTLDHYEHGAFAGAAEAREPPVVAKLRKVVADRSIDKYLDQRCPKHGGVRKFARGEKYIDLTPALSAQVPKLLADYIAALGERAPAGAHKWEIEDSAERIAGTGSLGCVRFAIVANDHVLDLKQANPSSVNLSGVCKPSKLDPGERVVTCAQKMVEKPPRHLAALPPRKGLSLIGRRLSPQEDKLDLLSVSANELGDVLAYVAHRLASGHRRSVGGRLEKWPKGLPKVLLDHAVELAGLFEAISLHYAATV